MMEFVCIACKDQAKGCTLIREDGNRLPLVCRENKTMKAKSCEWMEVPVKSIPLTSVFPFEFGK